MKSKSFTPKDSTRYIITYSSIFTLLTKYSLALFAGTVVKFHLLSLAKRCQYEFEQYQAVFFLWLNSTVRDYSDRSLIPDLFRPHIFYRLGSFCPMKKTLAIKVNKNIPYVFLITIIYYIINIK